MKRVSVLLIFIVFIIMTCHGEISFDYQFSFSGLDVDAEFMDLWLADYDEDGEDQIYVSYKSEELWQLIEYDQYGDTLRIITFPANQEEHIFLGCRIFKSDDILYLLVVYQNNMFRCLLEIYDYNSLEIIESDQSASPYFSSDLFRAIKVVNYNDTNLIFIGTIFFDDMDGFSWSSMLKYTFESDSLSYEQDICYCGEDIFYFEGTDFLISFNHSYSWYYDEVNNIYISNFQWALVNVSFDVFPEVENIYFINQSDDYIMKFITYNDNDFQEYGIVIWTSPADNFRCYSPDFSELLWESSNVGIEDMTIKSSSCVNTNSGDHFFVYFYTDGDGQQYCEIRNRITGNIVLSEDPEIIPFNILRKSDGELLFFCKQDTLINVYALAEEIQLGNKENEIAITEFNLCNYPNPFNPETTVTFSLDTEAEIELVIYNIKGQKIKTLADETFRPDTYNIIWKGDNDNGKKASSGVYFVKLKVNNEVLTNKVIMLK